MTVLKEPGFSANLAQQVYRILDIKDKARFANIALDVFSESLDTKANSLFIGHGKTGGPGVLKSLTDTDAIQKTCYSLIKPVCETI